MIFVTTGTQEPFDRLIEAVDKIAGELQGVRFVVQAFSDSYKARNFEVADFLPPEDYNRYLLQSKLIISHAGMGTIISCLVQNKAIIMMPRLMKYKEHRNEHQLATAKKLDKLGYVHVAYDEQQLTDMFFNLWPDKCKPLYNVGNVASDQLIKSLVNFIND